MPTKSEFRGEKQQNQGIPILSPWWNTFGEPPMIVILTRITGNVLGAQVISGPCEFRVWHPKRFVNSGVRRTEIWFLWFSNHGSWSLESWHCLNCGGMWSPWPEYNPLGCLQRLPASSSSAAGGTWRDEEHAKVTSWNEMQGPIAGGFKGFPEILIAFPARHAQTWWSKSGPWHNQVSHPPSPRPPPLVVNWISATGRGQAYWKLMKHNYSVWQSRVYQTGKKNWQEFVAYVHISVQHRECQKKRPCYEQTQVALPA